METKRFDIEKDLKRLENYLRDCYCSTGNMTSWLPERLHDLIYRMDVQYKDCGLPKSADYIFIWEDNGDIIGCILPDGDAVYMSIKNGSESIFADMVTYAEANCLPLFQKGRNGFVDFLVIANDSSCLPRKDTHRNGLQETDQRGLRQLCIPSDHRRNGGAS